MPASVAEKENSIMRNAYEKLDALPLGFGIPRYDPDMTDVLVSKYMRLHLKDALREIRIDLESIEQDTNDEYQIENRVIYHALKSFRLSASAFFKFSTAVDGKTVDKTAVPKVLKELIDEYDTEYKKWRSGHCGNLWQRSGE